MLLLKKSCTVLALAAAVGLVPQLAEASFTYSVSLLTTNPSFGSGSSLIVSAYNSGITSPTFSDEQYINLAQVTLSTTTAPPATDTATRFVSLTTTVNNLNGSSGTLTGTIAFSGTINVTRCDTEGAASTFTLSNLTPATLTLGGYQYTLSNPDYVAPTLGVGGPSNGSFYATLTETPIPEPASLSVLAVGAAALLCRRRRCQSGAAKNASPFRSYSCYPIRCAGSFRGTESL